MVPGPYIVCGLGQVGYRVSILLRRLGAKVTVITSDARSEWVDELTELGVEIRFGDARNPARVEEAGIRNAAAILALTTDDSINVEIMLDAKALNPEIRTIARIFDATLARSLEGPGGIGLDRGLAMSIIAAPNIASLALGEDLLSEFIFQDRLWSVKLGQSAQGAEIDLGGNQILSMDPIDRYKPVGRGATEERNANPISFIRAVWRNAPKSLQIAILGLVILSLASIAIFSIFMNLSVVDSIYFVITTLSTTGYGDISPKDASWMLKVFTCILMIAGSGLVTVFYAIVTDYLVSSRLETLLESRVPPEKDHIVVVGYGNVGRRVSEELLKLGQEIVVVDRDRDGSNVTGADRKLAMIYGDGRDHATLQSANIASASTIVAVTESDTTNLAVALVARSMNPKIRTVTRIFDGAFANKLQAGSTIDYAVSASKIAAPHFVASALNPTSISAYIVGDTLTIFSSESTAGVPDSRKIEVDGKVVHVSFLTLAPRTVP